MIRENGIPGYQPSEQPFDWLPGSPGGQRDLVLFSVRRGSAVLGQLDSRFNLPIGEGDVLGRRPRAPRPPRSTTTPS